MFSKHIDYKQTYMKPESQGIVKRRKKKGKEERGVRKVKKERFISQGCYRKHSKSSQPEIGLC